MSPNLIRWCGIAAMLGGAIEILVAPFINSAYSMTEIGADLVPPWEPAFSDALGPLFAFAPPEAVYETYGKFHFPVFLGLLFGLLGLRAWRGERAGRLERWGYHLSLVGFVLNLPGNVLDYWVPGNSAPGEFGGVGDWGVLTRHRARAAAGDRRFDRPGHRPFAGGRGASPGLAARPRLAGGRAAGAPRVLERPGKPDAVVRLRLVAPGAFPVDAKHGEGPATCACRLIYVNGPMKGE